jgi:type I restriction enzyme, S subunit
MNEKIEINLNAAIKNNVNKSQWVKWKFSDLVENIVEKVVPKDSELDRYIGLKNLDSGSLKIRRFGETSSLIGDKLKIYKGDLIFAKRNAYLKRVAIADFDAIASAHSMIFRAKAQNIMPEFLPFFLLSEQFWQRAIEISVGSLSPTINWKSLAKQEFLLPPKNQQAKFAELFWTIDDLIQSENNLLNSLFLSFKSEMKEIYSNTTENQVQLKGKIHLETGKRMKGGGLKQGDILSIGGDNINNKGGVDLEKKLYISEDFYNQMNSGKLKKNDILMMKDGAKTGKTALLDIDIKAATNEHVFIIRAKGEFFLQKYLYYFFLSNYGQNQIKKYYHGIIGGITREDIDEIEIPIINLKEQHNIINKLDNYQNLIMNTETLLLRSEMLLKSLIKKIF